MIRVIDIESTGIDPATDAIIEIASVDLASNGPGDFSITNPMQTFVNPGRPIPPHASAVHHILDEDVAGAPLLGDVEDRFRGADVYVAHKADFELSFVRAKNLHFRRLLPLDSPEPIWICTLKCALRLWPDWPAHNNQALRYQLGLVHPLGYVRDEIQPHRAMSDVIVTAANLGEMFKLTPWRNLVRWSREPALYTRLGFGKHKGKRFDEAPKDYLQWIIDKSEMEEAKESARYWLGLPCNITA